tara:strand:+ start:94 stop:312 length:219 start_codon:yes stop_codon:yes gene_type:complete
MKKPEDLTDEEQVDVLQRSVSREIVQEIMNYGVTQQQILHIINLLALELEDNNMMRSIVGLCKSNKTEKLHV